MPVLSSSLRPFRPSEDQLRQGLLGARHGPVQSASYEEVRETLNEGLLGTSAAVATASAAHAGRLMCLLDAGRAFRDRRSGCE